MHLQVANSVLFLIYIHHICSVSRMQPVLKHETKQKKVASDLLTRVLFPLPFLPLSFPVVFLLGLPLQPLVFHLLLIQCGLTSASLSVPRSKRFAASPAETQKSTVQRTDIIYGYKVNYPNIMKVESSPEITFCNFHVISRRWKDLTGETDRAALPECVRALFSKATTNTHSFCPAPAVGGEGGGATALSPDALAHLAASSVPSVWAGAACLPWHPPRSCKNAVLQHFGSFRISPLYLLSCKRTLGVSLLFIEMVSVSVVSEGHPEGGGRGETETLG